VWASPATDATDAEMAERGLVRLRTLHQLRRPLPVPADRRAGRPPLAVRPFRPGVDDDAWLEVNNRAFHWHPDQGGWDARRLRERLAEPWVDIDGFLVHDGDDGRLDGFCWTKVHPAADGEPALGEIFVIAADPSRHGSALGHDLAIAGLDHLASRGLSVAMLYVEADNHPALRLYRRLGFEVDHDDAAYGPPAHRDPDDDGRP
jgi:mycothiol synthase